MAPSALTEGSVNSASIPADIKDEIESKGYTIISDPPSWNGKLTINHKKEPFSLKEFRQALAYAIDRESLAQIVFRGHALPGSPGILPPTSVWYNKDIPQYKYDVEKAQQLISGLGYQLQDNFFVKDGKPLEVQLIAAADYKDLGQFITQQLELAGITVDFQTLEGKTVDNKVEAWDFDLSIYGHGGLYEPSILTRTIIGTGFNSTRYDSNKELTDLLNEQLTEMDAEKRKEMVFKIQELFAEDIPSISLYYPKSYWGHDGEIQLYYTMDGVAIGVPIPLNRMCFVKQ
jgi:peptide/nickel transport system substrate-binding protein